jgi:hypothetical protein
MIAEASQGTPRIINNICFNALSLCVKLKAKQVDAAMVAKVTAALQLIPQSNTRVAAAIDPPVAAAIEAVNELVGQPRKRKEFAGLHLTPQPADSAPPRVDESSDQPADHKFWERTKLRLVSLIPATAGSVMLWVPAAALVLVMTFIGVLRLTEVLAPPTHVTDVDQNTDSTVPQPPTPADPAATESTSPSDPANPESVPAPAPKPMQASASIPKPSPIAPRSAASMPTHSAPAASSPGSSQKPLQGSAAVPTPSAAAQPVLMTPQASAQPAATASGAAPPASQQAPAAPVAAAPKQVHAALGSSAPQPQPVAPATTAPSVHAALPQP